LRFGKAGKLAVCGILGALAVICLFFAGLAPTGRISLYAVSSFFSAVVIIEAGVKYGWVFYAATTLLGALLLPNKVGIIPYAVFFGLYGIVKFYIEKIGGRLPEYAIKIAYFSVCLAVGVFTVKAFFMQGVEIDLPWWVLIIVFEVLFVVYDYVYTLVIGYYLKGVKPKIDKG